uniref:Uncharacterized protein n=1 Tax=Anguilla anguilla TaxID=7936 RepID=A0A0E9S1E5_ANGAN
MCLEVFVNLLQVTFRDLLQSGKHLSQFLLSLCQPPPGQRNSHPEQTP